MKAIKIISIVIFTALVLLTTIHYSLFMQNEKKLEIVNDKYQALQNEKMSVSDDVPYDEIEKRWNTLEQAYLKEIPSRSVEYVISSTIQVVSFALCFFVFVIFIASLKGEGLSTLSKITICLPILFFVIPFSSELFKWILSIDILFFLTIPFFSIFISLLARQKIKESVLVTLCGVFICTPILIDFYIKDGYYNLFYRMFFSL